MDQILRAMGARPGLEAAKVATGSWNQSDLKSMCRTERRRNLSCHP